MLVESQENLFEDVPTVIIYDLVYDLEQHIKVESKKWVSSFDKM